DFPSLHDPWFEQFTKVQDTDSKEGMEEEEIVVLEEEVEPFDDGNPWYYDIENYCRDQSFPEYATADDRKATRQLARCYKIIGGVLHKKAFSGLFLKCIPDEECLRIMHTAHSGECGGHFNGCARRQTSQALLLAYP